MSVCSEEARKSKHLERQTQGYAPGDGAFASLPGTAKARQRSNATLHTDETRCLGGKAMNPSPGCRCFGAFGDWICVYLHRSKPNKQTKRRCADKNFVREEVLTALFHVPTLGGSHGAQHGEV